MKQTQVIPSLAFISLSNSSLVSSVPTSSHKNLEWQSGQWQGQLVMLIANVISSGISSKTTIEL
jgi:hypothetical protein